MRSGRQGKDRRVVKRQSDWRSGVVRRAVTRLHSVRVTRDQIADLWSETAAYGFGRLVE